MDILFVVDFKYPNPGASSKRVSNYIKALELENHNVKVLSFTNTKKGPFLFLVTSILIPFKVFLSVLQNAPKVDVVYIYGFGWLGQMMIIIASKLIRKPVGIEVCEKPYSIIGSRRDIILKYFKPIRCFLLEKLVFKRSQGFIVISEPLAQYVNGVKNKDAIICKIPILVDYDYYQSSVKEPDCRKPFLLHSARINLKKEAVLNVIISLAKIITEYNFPLHLYFTSRIMLSKVSMEIDRIIRQYNIQDYIHFTGEIDDQDLLEYQKYCSLAIINKISNEQNNFNFSTRLGEYLASGVPIITSNIGEERNYLYDNESCLVVDPNDIEMIVLKVKSLIIDSKLRQHISNNGKLLAKQKFDYKNNSKEISKFFEKLKNGNATLL